MSIETHTIGYGTRTVLIDTDYSKIHITRNFDATEIADMKEISPEQLLKKKSPSNKEYKSYAKAYEEGYRKGYEDGYEKGRSDAQKEKILDHPKAAVIQSKYNSANNALILAPIIKELREEGAITFQAMADALNARGIKTRNQKSWLPSSVHLLTKTIKLLEAEGKTDFSIDEHTKALIPIIEELKANNILHLEEIADALNNRSLKTNTDNTWNARSVSRLLKRIDNFTKATNNNTSKGIALV